MNAFGNPEKKPALCKFINNCREFETTKFCKFSHDKCRFGEECNDKNSCKFYHPEMRGKTQTGGTGGSVSKPKSDLSQVPCKFGLKCNKKDQGTCPFSHENLGTTSIEPREPREPSLSKANIICSFGAKCSKFPLGKCQYKHTNVPGERTSDNPTERNKTSFFPVQSQPREQEVSPNINYNEEFIEFERSKICPNYVLGSCNASYCPLTHQFTPDNILKRVYFRNLNGNQSTLTCSLFKINENVVYVFGFGNTLGFYELDEELQVLKTICPSEIKLGSPINKVWSFVENSEDLSSACVIIETQNTKYKLFPTIGEMNEISLMGGIEGATFFPNKNTLVIGGTNIHIETNGRKDDDLIRTLVTGKEESFRSISVLKRFTILGEKFLLLGLTNGSIVCINANLRSQSIQINANSQIVDISAGIFGEKPFAFVATKNNRNENKVFAVNLLDFSSNEILSNNQMEIYKVELIFDKLFVALRNAGVLMYLLPEFRKIRGRIPLSGEITNLQGDSDGNLIIVSNKGNNNNSSVSIFKVRK